MSALGMIAYMIASLIVGGVLTVILSIFRSIKEHDNFRSWRYMIAFSLIVAVAPYLYAEAKTKMDGGGMEKGVESVIKSGKVDGKVQYFRVMKSDGQTARVIIVAKEKTTLNENESCVIDATLVYDRKKGWKAKEYEFVDSFKRNKDGVTFPPYW